MDGLLALTSVQFLSELFLDVVQLFHVVHATVGLWEAVEHAPCTRSHVVLVHWLTVVVDVPTNHVTQLVFCHVADDVV